MSLTTEDHQFLSGLFAAADERRNEGFKGVYAKLDKHGERIARIESAMGLAELRIDGLEAEGEKKAESKKTMLRMVLGGIVTFLAGLGIAAFKNEVDK